MFADIVFRSGTVRNLLAAVLSRTERLDTGPPGFPQFIAVREICSWSPENRSVAASVAEVNLNTDLQLLRTDPSAFGSLAVPISDTALRFRPPAGHEVVVAAAIEVALADGPTVIAGNLEARSSRIVASRVHLGVSVSIINTENPNGTTTRKLQLRIQTKDRTQFPSEFLRAPLLNLLFEQGGLLLPIDLADVEADLGGVTIVAANIRCIPENDVIALRVFFATKAKFLPEPLSREANTLTATFAGAFLAFSSISGTTFERQLGGEEIVVIASEEAIGQIVICSLDSALPAAGIAHLETGRHEMTIVPSEERRLSVSSSIDVRLSHGCQSPVILEVLRPDIVARVDIRASLEVEGGNVLLVRSRSAEVHVHAGWSLLCGLVHLPVAGVVPLASLGVIAAPAILTLYRVSPQDIANRSQDAMGNAQLAYDPATRELQRRTPLNRITLPVPSAFSPAADPYAPGGPPAPASPARFGQFQITTISSTQVGNAARIGMRLIADIAGGNLHVTPRPVVGTPAPRNNVPAMSWTYRACDRRGAERTEIAFATAIRVANGPDPFELFRWNAGSPLELCRLGFRGAITQLQLAGIENLDFEWLDSLDRPILRQPAKIAPGQSVTLVISIPRSRLGDLVLQSRGYQTFRGFVQPNAQIAAFLENPGEIVLRTSAGRRVIRLPTIGAPSATAIEAVEMTRELQCGLRGTSRGHWEGAFAGRNLRIPRLGPQPFVLVDRLLNDSVRAQLPRLNLPTRNAGGLYSLEQRSVNAVLGRRAPNNAALTGLGPSNLNDIPAPMAAPIGLARLPRRP